MPRTPSILSEGGAVRLVYCPHECATVIHRHGPELGPRAGHCATDRPGGYELTEAEGLQRSLLLDLIRFMARRQWRPVHRGRPRIQVARLLTALSETVRDGATL